MLFQCKTMILPKDMKCNLKGILILQWVRTKIYLNESYKSRRKYQRGSERDLTLEDKKNAKSIDSNAFCDPVKS